MNVVRLACGLAVAAGLASAGSALAQTSGVAPRTQNNVTYLTGGVGTDEQDMLQSAAQEGYTLKLLFAERGTGAYVADVRVVVADASGATVLDTVTDGPALLAKLAPGQYRVTMEYKGMKQTRTVTARPGGASATVYWAAEHDSAPQPASERAPHGDAAPLAPAHAGEPARLGR